jgi:hypothetical protein
MKRILLVVLCSLPALASADEVADSCLFCHKDALTLTNMDPATIAARLRDFVAGRANHPVPIPPLDDAQIAALARALTAL